MRSARRSPKLTDDREIAELVLAVLTPLTRYLGRRLREQGAISVERFKALDALQDGPLRSNQLARILLLSPAALSRLADGLVADRLVVRTADAADRRAVRIGLTDPGRLELARGRRIVTEALGDILARLAPDERDRLQTALVDLGQVIEASQSRQPEIDEEVSALA